MRQSASTFYHRRRPTHLEAPLARFVVEAWHIQALRAKPPLQREHYKRRSPALRNELRDQQLGKLLWGGETEAAYSCKRTRLAALLHICQVEQDCGHLQAHPLVSLAGEETCNCPLRLHLCGSTICEPHVC